MLSHFFRVSLSGLRLPGRHSALALAFLIGAGSSQAVTVDAWFSENTDYRFDGLPVTGVRNLAAERMRLADGFDQGLYVLSTQSADPLIGLWRRNGSASTLIAQPNQSGTLGPGRPGLPDVFFPVANSPFRSIEQGGDGAVVFFGKAADPVFGANFATRGLWLNQGAANVEIARVDHTGSLGPGIDANTVFENSDGFAKRLMFSRQGRLALYARVGQGSNYDDALLTHTGSQWSPCAVDGSAVAAWSPGVGNTTFENLTSGFAFVINPQGQVFGTNRISNALTGVWEFCRGAPRLRALETITGSAGPGMGPDSRFTSLSRAPLPYLDDQLIIYGTGVANGLGGTPTFPGWFRNPASPTGPIALIGTSDATGPQIAGATFSAFPDSAMTQGSWFVFRATITTAGGNVSGLWRFHESTGIQPVALHRTPAFAPNNATLWTDLQEFFINDRGDVTVYTSLCDRGPDAVTCSGAAHRNEFWTLPRAGAPRRLLGGGDQVRFRTAAGPQIATIASVSQSFDDPNGGNGFENTGRDYWINRLGVMHASVQATGLPGAMHIRMQAFDPQALFSDGFE